MLEKRRHLRSESWDWGNHINTVLPVEGITKPGVPWKKHKHRCVAVELSSEFVWYDLSFSAGFRIRIFLIFSLLLLLRLSLSSSLFLVLHILISFKSINRSIQRRRRGIGRVSLTGFGRKQRYRYPSLSSLLPIHCSFLLFSNLSENSLRYFWILRYFL